MLRLIDAGASRVRHFNRRESPLDRTGPSRDHSTIHFRSRPVFASRFSVSGQTRRPPVPAALSRKRNTFLGPRSTAHISCRLTCSPSTTSAAPLSINSFEISRHTCSQSQPCWSPSSNGTADPALFPPWPASRLRAASPARTVPRVFTEAPAAHPLGCLLRFKFSIRAA